MFEDVLEAWVHGPAIHSVYSVYSRHGYSAIPAPLEMASAFSSEEEKILVAVGNAYLDLRAKSLEDLTHNEMPWVIAREGLAPDAPSQEPICQENMRNYYTEFGYRVAGEPYIAPEATRIDKGNVTLHLELEDSSCHTLPLSKLPDFIGENAGSIKYEQSEIPQEGVDLLF